MRATESASFDTADETIHSNHYEASPSRRRAPGNGDPGGPLQWRTVIRYTDRVTDCDPASRSDSQSGAASRRRARRPPAAFRRLDGTRRFELSKPLPRRRAVLRDPVRNPRSAVLSAVEDLPLIGRDATERRPVRVLSISAPSDLVSGDVGRSPVAASNTPPSASHPSDKKTATGSPRCP
jgi:hypothetical protein